jgi:hypothetical protein
MESEIAEIKKQVASLQKELQRVAGKRDMLSCGKTHSY